MQTLGKYEIVEKIGVGGFGVVYRGFDPFIKRPVAIKTCSAEDTETRERFRREAEIAGNLQHRNIVTVFEFGFENDTPYLVEELLSGEDLDRKIKRHEFVPLPEKILWLVQIARGLAFAHERGIVHRDIKPGNVRILDDGTAKILDFGIAKLAHQASNLTQAGMTLGTAAYLAPEQIRGQPVDSRTDVFSFGVLAFELLALERPFRAAEISAIFYKILHERPPSLAANVPDVPVDLDRIVARCLAKDPAQRWAPSSQLVHALEGLM
jgi:serine/threonine-protein kinase